MALEIGSHVGPYEITGILGKGGMGEVYRARDPRLNRDVAVKTSTQRFTERFEREARAIAALNHPNICQIYDVGPNYLVMELVEGSPPAGPMDLDDALAIADQIAAALQEAHEKLITHRDLKPGNILVTPSGVVKVLDFGLAKMGHAAVPDSENSPTLSMSMTQAGMILGTAAYMSPEQARGKPVDARADIWAFGVVLYEMLTGQRLFKGEDLGDTLASVVKEQPNLSAAPKRVHRLLEACLQKDPKKRLQSIGDMRLLLVEERSPEVPAQVPRSRMPWAVAAAGIVLAGVALWAPWRPPPAPPEVVKFEIAAPEKVNFTNWMSLSPNGRSVAFTARATDGQLRLWVRRVDSLESKSIANTSGNPVPFWSPDSRWIAYQLDGKLRKVEAVGGASQILGDAPGTFWGGTWNEAGVIVFGGTEGLKRVSAEGGTPEKITSIDTSKQEYAHVAPVFLPDNRHFLYHRRSNAENSAVYVGSLDDPKLATRLLASERNALFVPSIGEDSALVLFTREQTLMAQPFDTAKLALTGEAFNVASPVGTMSTNMVNALASANTLIYRENGLADLRRLTWADRSGKIGEAVTGPANWANVRLSPDGRWAAANHTDEAANTDVSTVDLARSLPIRLTFHKAADVGPVWSPDGRRLAFVSDRDGPRSLYWKTADGSISEEQIFKNGEELFATDWSRDGRTLLFRTQNPKTKQDLWTLSMDGTERKATPFLVTDANENAAHFSPDGKFVAYVSDESGRQEVYVRSFPDHGSPWQVSRNGGTQPRWRRDGKELYFVASTSMMVADVVTGASFQSGEPRVLFSTLDGGNYDVSADGQRFLIAQAEAQTYANPIKVILNWQVELKK